MLHPYRVRVLLVQITLNKCVKTSLGWLSCTLSIRSRLCVLPKCAKPTQLLLPQKGLSGLLPNTWEGIVKHKLLVVASTTLQIWRFPRILVNLIELQTAPQWHRKTWTQLAIDPFFQPIQGSSHNLTASYSFQSTLGAPRGISTQSAHRRRLPSTEGHSFSTSASTLGHPRSPRRRICHWPTTPTHSHVVPRDMRTLITQTML